VKNTTKAGYKNLYKLVTKFLLAKRNISKARNEAEYKFGFVGQNKVLSY
jgi:hypothetical protein